MNKKFISAVLAALLLVSTAAVTASADEVKAEPSKGATGTIKFDLGDWNHDDKINFYIWATNADGETLHASKDGWVPDDNWALKSIRGTAVEGEDGIVESYEFEFLDGYDTYVIFHDFTTGAQTYDCLITEDALGKTAYLTGEIVENPVDSEKTAIIATVDADGCGPFLQITSTGHIFGTAKANNIDPVEAVATFINDNYGTQDKNGEDKVTADKVAEALNAYGVSADDVWAKFQTLDGHEDKDADVKTILGIQDPETDSASGDTDSASASDSDKSSTDSDKKSSSDSDSKSSDSDSKSSSSSSGSTSSKSSTTTTTTTTTGTTGTTGTASTEAAAETGDSTHTAAFAAVFAAAAAAMVLARKKVEE